jgi:hypothetical protein
MKQFEKTKPIAGLRPEIRNSKYETRNELNGGYLKKQSQSPAAGGGAAQMFLTVSFSCDGGRMGADGWVGCAYRVMGGEGMDAEAYGSEQIEDGGARSQ